MSDSSVPGEGEHKMMDFIRQAKQKANYNPSTRHCFYGADADLIMLSLLTHEPNFTIIREEHEIRKIKQGGVQRIDITKSSNFQIIYISLLREYMEHEFRLIEQGLKYPFNLERIIDDFIFICFFVGNDFLPSLNTLDIGEGSLDKILNLYKQTMNERSDYITENGTIFWDRAETFIRTLAQNEHVAFKQKLVSPEHRKIKKLYNIKDGNSGSLLKDKVEQQLAEKKGLKI